MSTQMQKKEGSAPTARRETWRRPHYEVSGSKEEYQVEVYLPGVPKGAAEVTIENEQLTVIGRKNRSLPESWKQRYSELSKDDYRLNLQLNVDVDNENVQAQVADGILHIRLPLAAESRPRQITVE